MRKNGSKRRFIGGTDIFEAYDMIGSLEAKMYEKQKELDEAVGKIESKTFYTKRMNYEKFVGTDEPGPGSGINEAEAETHRGRKKGGRNFAGLDLEGLSKLNPTIIVDPESLDCPKCGACMSRIGY